MNSSRIYSEISNGIGELIQLVGGKLTHNPTVLVGGELTARWRSRVLAATSRLSSHLSGRYVRNSLTSRIGHHRLEGSRFAVHYCGLVAQRLSVLELSLLRDVPHDLTRSTQEVGLCLHRPFV